MSTFRSVPPRHVLTSGLLRRLPLDEHDGPPAPPPGQHARPAHRQPLQEPDGQDEGGEGRRGLSRHSGGSRSRRARDDGRSAEAEGPRSDAVLHPAPAHAQHDGEDQEGGGDGGGEGGEGEDGGVEPDELVQRERERVKEDVRGQFCQ